MNEIRTTYQRILVACVCAAVASHSTAQSYETVVPSGSPFALKERLGGGAGFKFTGQWVLEGRYVIESHRMDDDPPTPRVVFVPDSKYSALVPTKKIIWQQSKTSDVSLRHDKFDVLTFSNQTAVATALASDRGLRRLLAAKDGWRGAPRLP